MENAERWYGCWIIVLIQKFSLRFHKHVEKNNILISDSLIDFDEKYKDEI